MKLSRDMTAKVLALAGELPKRVRLPRKPTPRDCVMYGMGLTLTVPCEVVSEANRRDHWATKRKRHQAQRFQLAWTLGMFGLNPDGCELFCDSCLAVTFTRLGGKTLDDDNLASAFKNLRDAVAKWLAVDDSPQSGVAWAYAQELSASVGVRIEIRTVLGEKAA